MREKIKILYLCESLKVGGAEQLVLTTIKNLDRSLFSPAVYCLHEKGMIGQEIEKQGVKVFTLEESLNLFNFKIIYELFKVFKKEKPGILHTHLFYANYYGRIAALFSAIPVRIITEHGTHSNFKKFYHHMIDFVLSFFTSRIIAVSLAVKRYLCRFSFIPQSKISVIYNAIDTDRFDLAAGLDKNSLRQKFGLSDSELVFGCISTLVPWKGQDFLLKGFASVAKRFPSAKLCLIGRDDAGFKSDLQAYVRRNDLEKNVLFLGERRDIPEVLRLLDIFVMPSLTEGLGIALLEAMYMGLPSIATNTEGIAEIVEHQKDGLLFKRGDLEGMTNAMLTLASDKEKARQIGSNARLKVDQLFLPRHYMDGLQSLYRQLAEGKKVNQ
ncbi:MAG: glycosyltransferase [Candidatus Omnitrophica bacterium]|nr:glycosyltransferase [Candidatus Omnitrophota bacterium]MDD5652694.1 glycosyltransferase [Candidatus Omnitrophota bacterium]